MRDEERGDRREGRGRATHDGISEAQITIAICKGHDRKIGDVYQNRRAQVGPACRCRHGHEGQRECSQKSGA